MARRAPACRQGTGGVDVRGPTTRSSRGGAEPEHLLDDEPCLVSGAQRGGELSDQLAPGHGAPSSSPASWRARLSAMRASVSSVRSPAST